MFTSVLEWQRKRKRGSPPTKRREKRRRYDASPVLEGVKDVCICIRLKFEEVYNDNINVKWLKVKIPAILLQKRGATSPLDLPTTDEAEDDLPLYWDTFDCRLDPINGPLDLPTTDDKFTPLYWDTFDCRLDPINGPFDFPRLVDYCWPYTVRIRCTPIGSVMYALGGDVTPVPAANVIVSQACGTQVPPNPLVTTKAITGGCSTVEPVKLPSTNTRSNHASHCLHFCDFSQQNPKWEISPAPLISPRIWPKLVSMEGKIYAFGGNLLTDHQAPFAEVYDPKVGCWSPLPNPPFGRLADYELYVFPLHKSGSILLIGFVSGVVYTFNTSSWFWCPFPASSHLCEALQGIVLDDFHPVISDETLYWIDCLGRLCAYRLEGDGMYFVGPISVFEDGSGCVKEEHQALDRDLKSGHIRSPLALLPISTNLLGLLWSDFHFVGRIRNASTLHITILRISLHKEIDLDVNQDLDSYTNTNEDKDSGLSLTASTVACLCFPFLRDITSVVDAYLIDDDKESWQLMSSCSSYCIVNEQARF